MRQVDLDVNGVMSQSWVLAKRHGLVIAVFFFIATAIATVIQLFGFPWSDYFSAISAEDPQKLETLENELSLTYYLFSVVGEVAQFVLFAGIIKTMMDVYLHRSPSPTLSALRMPFSTYAKYVGVNLLYLFLTCLAFCCCILPGFYVGLRLQFSLYYVLEHPEEGIVAAIKKSWQCTEGNVLNLFLLVIISLFILILGYLCCCVGVYFSIALIYFMNIVVFFMLLPPKVEMADSVNAEDHYVTQE